MTPLELSKSRAVAALERVRDPWIACKLLDRCLGGFDSLAVRGNSRVELTDEPRIGVVPLALRRESAEHPHGDRERESQEQQARGEPQPSVGYFLSPLWQLPPLFPLPPPCSAGSRHAAVAAASPSHDSVPDAGELGAVFGSEHKHANGFGLFSGAWAEHADGD